MKTTIVLLLLFATFFCQAQTKVIAHKSHSGSTHTFKKAYQNNLFDINRSNYGLPGSRKMVLLDSIIAINDSLTVLKYRESNACYAYGTKLEDVDKSDFKTRTERVINHSVLNKKNSKSFIISNEYTIPIRFVNPIENVVFVGFKK